MLNEEKINIDSLIQKFNQLVEHIDPAISRRSFMITNQSKYSVALKGFSNDEKEKMKKIYDEKRIILSRILNFHFASLMMKGLDIREDILKMMGLKCCKRCANS